MVWERLPARGTDTTLMALMQQKQASAQWEPGVSSLSYSGLSYSAGQACSTLADVGSLDGIDELPLPLVRVIAGPAPLLAAGQQLGPSVGLDVEA